MKKKFSLILALIIVLVSCCGCGVKSLIKKELDKITITSSLPEETRQYANTQYARKEVYRQQLAAVRVLSEIYTKTDFRNFIEDSINQKNKEIVISACNDYKRNFVADVYKEFKQNLSYMVQDIPDMNHELFVQNQYDDLVTFYECIDRMERNEYDMESCHIALMKAKDTTNLFARMYLSDIEDIIVKQEVQKIEENSENTDNAVLYLEKNNTIAKSLVFVYGSIDDEYADRIKQADSVLLEKINKEGYTVENFDEIQLNLDYLYGRATYDNPLDTNDEKAISEKKQQQDTFELDVEKTEDLADGNDKKLGTNDSKQTTKPTIAPTSKINKSEQTEIFDSSSDFDEPISEQSDLSKEEKTTQNPEQAGKVDVIQDSTANSLVLNK